MDFENGVIVKLMDTLEMDYFSTFPGDGCGAYV